MLYCMQEGEVTLTALMAVDAEFLLTATALQQALVAVALQLARLHEQQLVHAATDGLHVGIKGNADGSHACRYVFWRYGQCAWHQ